MKLDSKLEFGFILKEVAKDLELVKEHEFHETRKWRFDYAVPEKKVAFEYEGRGKGHLTWQHYSKDCEKYSWAAILGWKVIRVTAMMVQDGRAGDLIRRALE